MTDSKICGILKGLSCVPDVTTLSCGQCGQDRNLEPDSYFLILASDGVWDVFSSEAAARFVASRLGHFRLTPEGAAQALACEARKKGSKDDITAVVITFEVK